MTQSDGLDELLADARLLLDARLDAHRPPPDLLDVLQRSRELDAELDVPFEPAATDNELSAPEISMRPSVELDPQLEEINADARRLLDGLLERPPVGRRAWRRRPRPAAAAAAALVVLGLAGVAFAANRKWQEFEAGRESERFAALAMADLDREWRAQFERESTASAGYRLPITPGIDPPAPVPAEPETEIESPAPTRELDVAKRLAQLDAEAYSLLRAGQHEQAARRFRTIVRIGGTAEYAELAYGELFALARRDGGDQLEELWTSYLKRFPRGRYADAARAGLCRRTPKQSQHECWTDYLLKHPHGAARGEALRETADD